MLVEVDARDRRTANEARLAKVVVDSVSLLVRHAALAELEALGQHVSDRVGETLRLLGIELHRERVGREAGAVQDLVHPGTTDAGDDPLVAKHRVEAAGIALQDLRELLGVELVGLGAEMRKLGLDRLGPEETDLRALLGPALGEDERPAVLELELEGGRLRLLLARLVEPSRPALIRWT